MRNTPLLTTTNIIILICIIAYAAKSHFFDQGFSGYELFYFENERFSPIQLLSHMFLHGGPTHLFFNMFGLWMFGNSIERLWGVKKFVLFYFICGLGAAALYSFVNYYQLHNSIDPLIQNQIFQSRVVGASGALYGVLVAFAFLFPNNKIMLIFLPVPVAAKFFVPALLALDILSEFTGFSIFGQNIAHAAHVGGAVTAVILMLTVMNKRVPGSGSSTIWRK